MPDWLDSWTNTRRLSQQELAKRWATRNDPPQIVEKPRPPPYWQTMRFLKNAQYAKWRPLGKDEPFPIEFDDPAAQAAWESIYKDRKWILRVPPDYVQGTRL
jgi:hypothetical protein